MANQTVSTTGLTYRKIGYAIPARLKKVIIWHGRVSEKSPILADHHHEVDSPSKFLLQYLNSARFPMCAGPDEKIWRLVSIQKKLKSFL